MPGPNGEMCGNCKCFHLRNQSRGDCRLKAPSGPDYMVGCEGDVIRKSPWPQVQSADWCITDFMMVEGRRDGS